MIPKGDKKRREYQLLTGLIHISVMSHKFIVIVRLDPEASPGQAAIQNSLKRLDSVLRLDRGIKSGNDVVVELCNLLMGQHTRCMLLKTAIIVFWRVDEGRQAGRNAACRNY
jgi:hypothetical protein